MSPLASALKADVVSRHLVVKDLKRRSWRVGHGVQVVSNCFYGSAWNQWFPVVSELAVLRQMRCCPFEVLHFLWGEFMTPACFSLFRRKAKKVIGTFHCSQRRQWRVTMKPRWYLGYDHIVLMSESQKAYFVDCGYPEECVSVILHGVDTDHFRYADQQADERCEGLNLLIVGSTERDNEFAASVLRALGSAVRCTVLTRESNQSIYAGLDGVTLLNWIDDDQLVQLYQRADLLLMPLLDCTANNAILESMACGTPVMVNCVGGVPEYVDPDCNFVMVGKQRDEWVAMIQHLADHRDELAVRRKQVRTSIQHFDWRIISQQYVDLYQRVLGIH